MRRPATRITIFTLVIVAAFAVVDLFLLFTSNVYVARQNWFDLCKASAGLLALYILAGLVIRRLASDDSRKAKVLIWIATTSQTGVRALALFIPLGFVTALFMYLVAANGRPLMDGELAAIDMMLGFDWVAFHSATSSPLVSSILIVSYHALGPQVLLVYLLHAAAAREGRAVEFTALMAASSILTGAGMAAVPAAGAYAFYLVEPGAFTSHAGMWHLSILNDLRSGVAFPFIAAKLEGLTTFPSFHTALGIMIVYNLRDSPRVQLGVAILNLVMIVSTLPEGGHYLIDVIAGIAVACVSIVTVRTVAGKETRQGVLPDGLSA